MRLEGVVERVRRESWRSLSCWGEERRGSVEEAFGRSFSAEGLWRGVRVVAYIGSRTRCPRRISLGG